MWTWLFSKMGLRIGIAAIVIIVVGFLFMRNQTLKAELLTAKTEYASLETQYKEAQNAVKEVKETLQNREKEIASAKKQVEAGNTAVKEYRSRIDKFSEILQDAKCVSEDEKTGVLDAESNDAVIDALNCLATGSCERVLPKTTN